LTDLAEQKPAVPDRRARRSRAERRARTQERRQRHAQMTAQSTTPESPAPARVEERPARREARIASRYDRPRTVISYPVAVFGIIVGIVGGLFLAWNVAPTEEFDTVPRQLGGNERAQYVVAVMLAYQYDGDFNRALNELVALNLGADPIQAVADIACDLASTGYAATTSGQNAIRSLIDFYQPQGRTGCATDLIPAAIAQASPVIEVTVSTPTLRPPASKTPTPVGTPVTISTLPGVVPGEETDEPFLRQPTPAFTRQFSIVQIDTYCRLESSGLIEVRVRDSGGEELPAQPVRVRWDQGESIFYTGLHPDRGLGYADFQMEAGVRYTIDMPSLSDAFTQTLDAAPCATNTGDTAVTSYIVWFRANA